MDVLQQTILYLYRNSKHISNNDKFLLEDIHSIVFNKCKINSVEVPNGFYTIHTYLLKV
jgi:hypothetical protein